MTAVRTVAALVVTLVVATGCGGDGGGAVPEPDAAPVPPDARPFEPVDVSLTRVSVSANGDQGNADARQPVASADGRYVAFVSSATTLVEGDTSGAANGPGQVLVVDRMTGTVERASLTAEGDRADEPAVLPVLSDDGRTVVFSSAASNLAAEARADLTDVFVRNLDTLTTTVASTGLERHASRPSMSGDAGFIAFETEVENITVGGTRDEPRVFGFSPGDAAPAEFTGDGVIATLPAVSGDAEAVAFAIGDQLWVHDRTDGSSIRATRVLQGEGSSDELRPSIATDGSLVAFTNGNRVYAVVVGAETLRVGVSWAGEDPNGPCTWPSMSGDGRFVAFACDADNLVPSDENGVRDVFLRDLDNNRTVRLSITTTRAGGNGASDQPHISRDGRFIVFTSQADNLVDGDTNNAADIFIADNPLL